MNFCYCCDEVEKEKGNQQIQSEIEIKIVDALPMLVRNSPYGQILSDCTKKKVLFIDDSFPPDNKALGEYQHIERKLVWKRASQIVKDPILYSVDQNPIDCILAVTSSISYMKAALLSLAMKPQQIYNIFGEAKQANPYGIYRLKVKINGIFQELVIDDFIPVFQDTQRPLLCGTIGHQIWMMLIFKAYAKIVGSYSAIQSEDCFSVLNTFSSGPCFSYLLDSSLTEDSDAVQQIVSYLKSETSAICVTTSKKPGLNLCPDYNYSVRTMKNDEIDVIGLGLDESLLHKMSLNNLLANCSEMAVSENDPLLINSEEQQLTLQQNKPFFLSFDLQQAFALVFSFWRDMAEYEQNFIRVIVGKKEAEGKYSHVASKLQAYYRDMCLECPQMPPGSYKMMIMIRGSASKEVKVNLICYRKMKGQLSKVRLQQSHESKTSYIEFMESSLHHLMKNSKNIIARDFPISSSTLSMAQFYRKGGFGCLSIVGGSKGALKHLRVKIDQMEVKNSRYRLLNVQESELVVLPNTEKTMIFLLDSLPSSGEEAIVFPPGVSILEVF